MNGEPGHASLEFNASATDWATAEFIRKPPNRIVEYTVYFIAGLIVTALTYCYFARIPISIRAQGVLVYKASSLPIILTNQATIKKLYAKENAPFKKGDLLLTTDLQFPEQTFLQLKGEVASIRKVIATDKNGKCNVSCEKQLSLLASTAFDMPVKGILSDIILSHRELLQAYADNVTAMTNSKSLVSEKYRQIGLAQSKLRKIKEQGAESMLAIQVERLNTEIGSLRTSIAERGQAVLKARQASRDRLENRLDGFLKDVEDFRSQQTLLAPIDGVVKNLKIAEGQRISPGTVSFELVPSDSDLVAEITVANQDISRIFVGMEAVIKVDAYPERRYGALGGKVYELPISADEQLGGGYRIKVNLDKQSFHKGDSEYPLRLGMRLSSQLVSGRERILSQFIDKVLHLTESVKASL